MTTDFHWKKGFNAQLLIRRIRESRKVNDDRVSMDAFASMFWTPVLSSAIATSPVVARIKDRCITKVIFDAGCNLTSPDQFLADCQIAFNSLQARPTKKYVLLCGLTYVGKPLFEKLLDDECTIWWQPKTRGGRFKRAIKEREKLSDIMRTLHLKEPDYGITHVMVEVSAASVQEAADKAFDGIDRFRGLINLLANSNRGPSLSFNSAPHAVNRMRRGPFSTLHAPDGELASEIVWYEPRWSHESKSISFKAAEKEVQKDIKKWWIKARSGPLSEHVGRGLLRYCHALDDHDLNQSLFRLWATLEMLTGTGNAKYEVTVSRIVKIFTDSDEARQIAEHVRWRRNDNIHNATSLDEEHVSAVVLHADLLCVKLLKYCIVEGRKFRNADELFEFLDSDLDVKALKRRQHIAGEFIKYRGRLEKAGKASNPKSPMSVSKSSDGE